MAQDSSKGLLERLRALAEKADSYLTGAEELVPPLEDSKWRVYQDSHNYWDDLPPEVRQEGLGIANEVASLAKDAAAAIRQSPLLTEADQREAGHAVKGMRAALRLRRYAYWSSEVLHDEGTVLGLRPAGDSEDVPLHPAEARVVFNRLTESLANRLELTSPTEDRVTGPVASTRTIAAGYRPGTAFVMMWMAPERPELEDVSNTVKRCFDDFGIAAVRADDIEHEDVITQKILDEIKTAEFLFADLSGERPSVYYEVGYAHALGRRVIMFRRTGTEIHFDLAAYNCPEYQNLSDLESKLKKRLEYVTGGRPRNSSSLRGDSPSSDK